MSASKIAVSVGSEGAWNDELRKIRKEILENALPAFIGKNVRVETQEGAWSSHFKRLKDDRVYLAHTIGTRPDEISIKVEIPTIYIDTIELER
jgi:hypothetical protein